MNYTNIIDDFTWSYSRISQFGQCPYGFLMKYILQVEKDGRQFFAQYGTLMHDILRGFYLGELKREDLAEVYMLRFFREVTGKPPNKAVFSGYFSQGLRYLREFVPQGGEILAVEKDVRFNIDGYSFVGFVDLLSREEDGIVIFDHKSRDLSPRSGKKKPTKSDRELDEYLRQLYLYALPIKEEYGEFPKVLALNCFRSGTIIREPFDKEKFHDVIEHEKREIESIRKEENWKPDIDWFKCRYLCDVSGDCEYYQMTKEVNAR